MKKVLKVLGIVFLVIAALLFFVPRFILLGISAKYKPDINIAAVDFSEYPVSFADGGQVTVSNGKCSISIPEGFELKELEKGYAYSYEDSSFAAALTKPTDFSANLLSGGNENSFLADWFGMLGRGLPDSGYATEKYTAQLTTKDYSFFSLRKSVVYFITGALKSAMYHGKDTIYIYEKGNVRGVISTEPRTDKNTGEKYYRVQCDFFSADDLNTVSSVLISVNSPEEAYPIINSVKFN